MLRPCLALPSGVPAVNTFRRVLEGLAVPCFADCFRAWLQGVLPAETAGRMGSGGIPLPTCGKAGDHLRPPQAAQHLTTGRPMALSLRKQAPARRRSRNKGKR